MSAHLLMAAAELLGGGSLVLFAIFVFAGPVVSVHLDFSAHRLLYWDALLSLLFFVQHSLMVRRWFKHWFGRCVPDDFHGAFYSIASGVVLALTMLLWQRSSTDVYTLSGPAAWILRVVGILAIAGFAWGVGSLRTFDTFGRLPISARLRGEKLPPAELVVRGAYRWVRHPLMFFMTALVWSNPVVTADRMLFNVLWSIWLVLGSFWEECDLIAEFGDAYRSYQRIVPRLLPWHGPVGKRWHPESR